MLLYQVIYPEIELLQEPVFDLDGVQWGGPGRNGSDSPAEIDVWKAWIRTYQVQTKIDFSKIPRYVNEYFQKAKMFSRPPTLKELDFTLILSAHNISIDWTPIEQKEVKEKPFAWSASALNSFESCPFAFAEERIYKRVKKVFSQEAKWGIEVHGGMATNLKTGEVNELSKPYQSYIQTFLSCSKDELLVEQQYAITKNYKFTEWFGQDVWGRGVLDVGIIKGDWCGIYDWKTGKRREDPTELEIFLFLTALKYPHLQRFNGTYVFLKEQNPGKAVLPISKEVLTRQDILLRWAKIQKRIVRMEEAVKIMTFQKRKSGLCRGWCACKDCEHWEEKR